MPTCDRCRADYPAGSGSCPACGAAPEWSEDPVERLDLVSLATLATVAEADMIREMLESNGIPSLISGEQDPIGITSGAVPVELRVSSEDLERARELYHAFFERPVLGADFEE